MDDHATSMQTRASYAPRPAGLLRTEPLSIEGLRDLARSGRLYAVLDACDAPEVPLKARELGLGRAVSLYRGSAEEMYWAIAPYLFAVDEAVLDWINETLWDEPFGIFAVADAGLDEARRHFRRFLIVQSPEGEPWYFRFYDPRVLPPFLSSCSEARIRGFFGQMRSYGIFRPNLDAGEMFYRRSGEFRVRLGTRSIGSSTLHSVDEIHLRHRVTNDVPL